MTDEPRSVSLRPVPAELAEAGADSGRPGRLQEPELAKAGRLPGRVAAVGANA